MHTAGPIRLARVTGWPTASMATLLAKAENTACVSKLGSFKRVSKMGSIFASANWVRFADTRCGGKEIEFILLQNKLY